jgi:hypothetical protein
MLLSEKYADECYKNGDIAPTLCNVFRRSKIPFTMENASCPFPSEMCISPAVALDTNLLDLNVDFSLNLAVNDKVRFRRRSTCAVLSLEGLVSEVDAKDLHRHYLGRPAYPQE